MKAMLEGGWYYEKEHAAREETRKVYQQGAKGNANAP
jgi:hypothetical protein